MEREKNCTRNMDERVDRCSCIAMLMVLVNCSICKELIAS